MLVANRHEVAIGSLNHADYRVEPQSVEQFFGRSTGMRVAKPQHKLITDEIVAATREQQHIETDRRFADRELEPR